MCQTPAPEPADGTQPCTPAGQLLHVSYPASAQISAKRRAERLVLLAGLKTTVLPIARAGHTFQASRVRGKFHDTIAPTTPAMNRVGQSRGEMTKKALCSEAAGGKACSYQDQKRN
ncbi:hypothetical protein E2C01_028358 [Portunus trituberculatus]|uniref:Uncharacterized protein n=1 Tax=Portunus trituberculatus TaxID=210409 RepID=A0A5B7EPT4_PORTR|nr:hypothetical protein [Portunus trituberculatus]